jgi:trimeric autotransporter adhesin
MKKLLPLSTKVNQSPKMKNHTSKNVTQLNQPFEHPDRALACVIWMIVSLSTLSARAVMPPPDGGYAGGNTAEGTQSLFNLTTGLNNTALGYRVLFSDTTGSQNTGSGAVALFANSTGAGNVAMGFRTLVANSTGSDNTGVGFEALTHNTIGVQNTGVGNLALANNVSGNYNIAVGTFALGNTTGTSNIAVGDGSGFNLTTGNYNIDIGNAGIAAEGNTIRIGANGNQTNTYVAGIFGVVLAGGGDTVYCDASGHLGTIIPSSARFKENIKLMDKASDGLLSLKPVIFNYKKHLDAAGQPQFGLVAEEVEKVNPALVVHDKDGKPLTVRYEAVNAMLLNEFLKEHRKVVELEAARTRQKTINAEQQKAISTLTSALKEQTERVKKVSAEVEAARPVSRRVVNGL